MVDDSPFFVRPFPISENDKPFMNDQMERLVSLGILSKNSTSHTLPQGGHGTGKTGNLAGNFSRQGNHREFIKFNFLHRVNCGNTGKILKI